MDITLDLSEPRPLREVAGVLYDLARRYPQGEAVVTGQAVFVVHGGEEADTALELVDPGDTRTIPTAEQADVAS